MKLLIQDMQERQRYASLPFSTRFKYFFTLKKRRFFYLFLIYMWYKYGERITTWVKNRRLRAINKYKRRWLTRFTPETVTYQTAIDTSYYTPAKLNKETADRLGEAFVRVDRQLKNGFSRQLIVNILARVSFFICKCLDELDDR